jgi:hypothetical protein
MPTSDRVIQRNRRGSSALTEAAASLSVEPGLEAGTELAEDALRPQNAKAQTRSDSELIEQFVQERCPSGHTESNYRASLRRLGWFCDWIGLQSVRQLQRPQAEAAATAEPEPASRAG